MTARQTHLVKPEAVSDASSIQAERQRARVLLPDLARQTNFSILYLLHVETGQRDAPPRVLEQISAGIKELERKRLAA